MVLIDNSFVNKKVNANYNLSLSTNRAESTKAYFINQGMVEKRIIAKGYGETVQIEKCKPIESCTEQKHELNRRSEFVIKNL